MPNTEPLVQGSIQAAWSKMDAGRSALLKRCEQYASWTLPYLFPKESDTVEQTELPVAYGSIGARCVNHLSNVIVETLFPMMRNFFRIMPGKNIKALAASLGVEEVQISNALALGEKEAINKLNMGSARAVHVEAAKQVIVTGNALLFYPVNSRQRRDCICYDLRDYVISLDRLGAILHCITRDKLSFGSLPQAVQELANRSGAKCKAEDAISLYTEIKWDADKQKYRVSQAVNGTDLSGKDAEYPKDTLPWVNLTWHRRRNENYGRGLVEDYAFTFNAYNSLSESFVMSIAIMADIKRFVRPDSTVDVVALNSSPRGEFIAAEEGSIWSPNYNSSLDLQAVSNQIQREEQLLGQAFMLTGAAIRDAERVTAEEIQVLAAELEKSHGGIYSKLALEWQTKLAMLLMSDVEIPLGASFEPQVISGMDSLARTAEVENLYLVFRDLAALGSLPETIQPWVDVDAFIRFISANRNVAAGTLFKSAETVAKEQQAAAEQQQALNEQGVMSEIASKTVMQGA